MPDEVLKMRPDKDLAEKLRKDFTAEACVRSMFDAVADMAAAVGVTVVWRVANVDNDMDVEDKAAISDALSRFATASGAVLAGSKVNPIRVLKAQDPFKILRDEGKSNVKK